MPSTTFTHVEDAILAPPSASDGPGAFYGFRIKKIFKLGRAKEPRKRQGQWARQCRGERHHWLPYYWEVPFYKKFEKIVHRHYKAAGAWLTPHRCRFCSVRHQEKFSLKACGGVRGLVGVVEHYLGRLNWPVIRAFTPPRRAPTCGLRLPSVLKPASHWTSEGDYSTKFEVFKVESGQRREFRKWAFIPRRRARTVVIRHIDASKILIPIADSN
ncbi:hypothetical protein B0H11DRAFT_2245267 [Mycena galericulata]|nr:hypothetical protein B0H11DRAFT_2245267 [Mycena galericulata]